MDGGSATHGLDRDAIRELAPDLVLTQDLCEVCAVPAGHLRAALDALDIDAEVISLDPSSLEEVLGDLVTVGKATGTEQRAAEIVDDLHRRLARVRAGVEGAARPRAFALEWGDPPYNSGHWVPEMIELAGGEALIASRGVPSVRITWEEIADADPEVVVFMPCGYDLEGASNEAAGLLERRELAGVRAFYAVAANSFFSRPGPRLVDGVEALASVLHEECAFDAKPEVIARLR
jgi:iron complex transport system substrate-binding protein